MGELKRYNFSIWHFFTVWVSPPGVSSPLTMTLLTEAPDEIYRVGLLATIFLGHNSHLPPVETFFFFSLMYPKHPQQCLEHRKCSINICWIDNPGMQTNEFFLCLRLEIYLMYSEAMGSLTPSWRLKSRGWRRRRKLGERSDTWELGLTPIDSLVPALRPFQDQAANHYLWINSFLCASASSKVLAQGNIENLEADMAKVTV